MNEKSKNAQKWMMYGFVGSVTIVALGAIFLMGIEGKPEKTFKTTADLPLDNMDTKEVWMDQVRTENEIVHGKVNYIQDMVVGRIKEDDATQKEISVLRKEIDSLRSELNKNQIIAAPTSNVGPTSELLRRELRNISETHHQESSSWNPFTQSQPPLLEHEIFEPLTCTKCPEREKLHHIDRSIPAGTSVKAILMSSVDAPCGVKGSSDPLPIKLRIIADGYLPKQVRARLKGGVVTASVHGDLSSERVYIRLEKLTQVRADGHYIETQVAGYVSGEDGKYGIRGTVVDKSALLIENAMISGFLSGASSFFEAAVMARISPCAPAGGCGPTALKWQESAGQIAVGGSCEGVSNAMDALTDYFIKRAEQLRPVIQVSPGRIVDITFIESADLGDLHTHEKACKPEETR